MARRMPFGKHRLLVALAIAACAGAIVAAALGVASATDQPQFCSSCHEMGPYHQAWANGPHANVDCVECHVDRGLVKRLEHKFVALSQVREHLFGSPTFPLAEAPEVPDERCLGCHESVKTDRPGFSHAEHASKAPCQDCHADVGHAVSAEDLGRAGILNVAALQGRTASRTAVVGEGKANLAGHPETDCDSCHDMKATACSGCHEPKHRKTYRGECSTCHAPGARFVFSHPASTECADCHALPAKHRLGQSADTACVACHQQSALGWAFDHNRTGQDCATCHARPASHREGACGSCHNQKAGISWAFDHKSAAACSRCHTPPAGHRTGECSTCHVSGTQWSFKHPARSSSCASCHTTPARHYGTLCSSCHTPTVAFKKTLLKHPSAAARCTSCHRAPAGHSTKACTTCHKVGTTWAFSHPSASATCSACHAAPSRHRAGACTTCHRVGKTWRFYHPSSTRCTACHSAPSGHSTAGCTTCHKVGTNWAFYHPSSTSCASCHRAPANHYGTSCASCHSPSAAWSRATFSHPTIPGREHTYRSFACSNCHPNGYSSATCVKCHDGSAGPSDD